MMYHDSILEILNHKSKILNLIVTGHTPTGGCSRESLAMGESLTKRRYVKDEALRGVNFF